MEQSSECGDDSKVRVCVISGRYPRTSFESPVNHKIYADTHGYDYVHCNWPTKERNLYLNKIRFIQSHMDSYDFVVWIDDDAFFWDFTKDIMDFAPVGNEFLSACKSPSFKPLKTFFSSGQFILKVNDLSKEFLQCVLTQDMGKIKNWWTDELGYFSNGDQDAMIYLFKSDNRFQDGFRLYDYKDFNSRPENLLGIEPHMPLILHFTGNPRIKENNYYRIQAKFNMHPSLVPSKFLKEYRIVDSFSKFTRLRKKIITMFNFS